MKMTREQWLALLPEKPGEAKSALDTMLMAAKRLDDEDINDACEQMAKAMLAVCSGRF